MRDEYQEPGQRTKKWRVAVLNSHPIQYFAPLYAFINQDEEIELHALYYSDASLRGGLDPGFGQNVVWNIDLLRGYTHKFVGKRARTAKPGGFTSLIVPEIWNEIRDGKYDAVILHGHMYAADIIAFLAAKSANISTFMHCETHSNLTRPPMRRAVRNAVLRRYYAACTGCLAIGSANREFYRDLGITEDRLFTFPYTVDNQRFSAAADRASGRRESTRRHLGLTDGVPTVLYASKLQRRKHPDDVIHAASMLAKRGLPIEVLMVGSGEMLDELMALATVENVRVVFAGFVNQAEMPGVMAAADIFALPSHNEPWGLVVNEAMCAGLPVIVGSEVGCAADIVREGQNGFTCVPGQPGTLAMALENILSTPGRTQAMGQASRKIISRWSYAECVEGLRAALTARVTRKHSGRSAR